MKLRCPNCNCVCGANAWQTQTHVFDCLDIARKLPREVADVSLEYVGLFRSKADTDRGLSWAKASRIMQELFELVKSGHIQIEQKPARPCDPKTWGTGIKRMIDCPPSVLPLKSHGYLKTIVYALADVQDQKKETAYHQRVKACSGVNHTCETKTEKERYKPSKADFEKVYKLAGSIGKPIK